MKTMTIAARDRGKWIHPAAFLLVPALSTLAEAQSQVPAFRIDYVRTLTNVETGESETVEYGHHFISEDGFRTRVDRFREGEAVSEIVRPDVNDSDEYAAERFTMNHSAREVTLLRPERYYRPVGSAAPVLLPPEVMAESPRWLGYRAIGDLVLSGFRVVGDAPGDTLELWHVAASPTAAAIERRSTTPDGVIDEERITDVERVMVDEDLFEVPPGYRTGRRAPWLR